MEVQQLWSCCAQGVRCALAVHELTQVSVALQQSMLFWHRPALAADLDRCCLLQAGAANRSLEVAQTTGLMRQLGDPAQASLVLLLNCMATWTLLMSVHDG